MVTVWNWKNQFHTHSIKEESMQKKEREDVALFRFGVISDLVCSRLELGELTERITEKSQQRWHIPCSGRTRISTSTIRRWVRLYEKSGRQLSSLYPTPRSDRGRSRRVDEETILSLVKLRKEMPGLPVVRLIEEMVKRNLCPCGLTISLATAYRILKQEGLSGRSPMDKTDRRRYEAEYPNDIWQSDVMHGPKVLAGGKMRKTYLIAFLDDHSRLLPYADFYLSEGIASFLDAFRLALLTRGVPRKLYVDNGAAYRSRHLERVCASLGIALIHTPPYTPQGRGKIERFFRTVRAQFLSGFQGKTLKELNECLDLWITDQYHQRPHSSTGQTPFNRFANHVEMIRNPPSDLEDHFRKEVRRRVTKDRTVSIEGRLYEAPTRFIGEQLSLLFHEHKQDRVEIIHQGRSHGLLVPLDLNVNASVKRERPKQGCLPFDEVEGRP
jgi:putative transposase